jgi:NhaP-type Na+/H+ or K+/H+ antiporter
MMQQRVLTIRAVLGVLFGLFGIGIAIQVLVRPGPKYMGLAFACVLIALGFVRVRAYLKARSEQP